MANLPELNEFTSGIYQIETADPVLGGVDGVTNVPLKALANRTKYLKAQVDALNTAIASAIDAAYVQAQINKLPFKSPVVAVTTTNITLSGLQTIDGVTLTAGQRVLVAAQSTGAQNGIYLAQSSAWTRATDMDADSEIEAGVQVMVAGGTVYADTIWHLLTDGTITIGTTAQTWKCLTNDTALLGNPTAPTAAQFDADTSLANTAFVQRALGNYQGALTLSGNTTLVAADIGKALIWGDATNITVTLPSLATCPKGGSFVFMNTNSANMTIQRAGTDTIDNGPSSVTSIVVPPYSSLEIITATGTSLWHVVGANTMDSVSSLFGASLSANGYQKLPSGLIIQWGTGSVSAANVAEPYSLPIAFPTAGRSAVANHIAAGSAVFVECSLSTTQITLRTALAGASITWIAIGH